jgi:dihydroorotate dehydrogenase electron transfer subunit
MPEFQEKCRVSTIDRLAPDIYRLAVHAPLIAAAACPGQFIMLRIGSGYDPLLRRPFSIHQQFADGTLLVLFKTIGRGTALISRLEKGDEVDLIGPLGRGFDLNCQQPVCLIGGGMGIAPLAFLGKRLAASGRDLSRDYVLLGARNREELEPLADELSGFGYPVLSATDDGSMGHHGFIPELLEQVLPEVERVYCCGPHPMMHSIVRKCRQADVICQVSLETHMACGLGACLGCTVKGLAGSYVHVCKQGPVFYSGEVAWAE